MNCKILFSCLILVAGSCAFSQNKLTKTAVEPVGDSPFTIGSKGGYGHSFLFPYNNCGYHSSWEIGLALMYMADDHIGFSLDGLYSSEGATFKTGDLSSKTMLSYMRIPLKVNYFFRGAEKDFRPKIAIGPSLGILLEEADYSGYEKIDYGATGSLGFSYRLLRGFWLSCDAGYYHSLKDISPADPENVRNGNLRLEIGLLVGL
jgi:outer membrane protein W